MEKETKENQTKAGTKPTRSGKRNDSGSRNQPD